jgi:hypothetical protein
MPPPNPNFNLRRSRSRERLRRQLAAAFQKHLKSLFFKFSFESASKLAHSKSLALKNYAALAEMAG